MTFKNVDMNGLKCNNLQLNGLQLNLSQISYCADFTTLHENEVGMGAVKGEIEKLTEITVSLAVLIRAESMLIV